jgi:hypothetical protein
MTPKLSSNLQNDTAYRLEWDQIDQGTAGIIGET